MDKDEKRRLKKLGKEIVEQRSADLKKALNESNPAPIGSDAWVKNYKEATENEKWVRSAQPMMFKRDWEKRFIVRKDEAPGTTTQQGYRAVTAADGKLAGSIQAAYTVLATPETYLQCTMCETILPTLPAKGWFYWKSCECGNATRISFLIWFWLRILDEDKMRFVRLIGKGNAEESETE